MDKPVKAQTAIVAGPARHGTAGGCEAVRARIGPYTLVGAVEVEEKSGRRGRTPRREVHASPDCWALPGGGTASVRELRRIAARNGWPLVLPEGADYLQAMRARPLYFVTCHTTNWDRLGTR